MSEPVALAGSAISDAPVQAPPNNFWSDEPTLESDFHRDQINLLIRILRY